MAGTGNVASDAHFVFFNNLQSPDGSVEHAGDNLTGGGEGGGEVIKATSPGGPARWCGSVFPVSIYEAETRGRTSARSATRSSASSTRTAARGRRLTSARSGF